MKTLKDNNKNEIIIKNSRFICLLYKLDNVNNIDIILNNIKTEYKDATHYCYAYIFDNTYKSNDDGEPGGTAGVPIMETLNNKDLNYILCVVTRYFGGIKLGAGGLVRAYRKATIEAINNSTLLDLIDGYEIIIKVSYNEQKDLEYLLKDNFKKEYDNDVTYTIKCNKDIKEILEKKYNILSVIEIKIEKEN